MLLPRHLPTPLASRTFFPPSSSAKLFNSSRILNNKPTYRYFSASAANMTIKAYFDCAWTGPTVEVDQKGNVTSVSKDTKGECAPPSVELCSARQQCHQFTSQLLT
jgi:hypothetical protein